MQRQDNDDMNTQEADVRVEVEDLQYFNQTKRLTIQATQQDFTNITETDIDNPFGLVLYSKNEM